MVDYAVMQVDAHFGFRKVDEMAKTPEEYREMQRHCGWPPLLFKQHILEGSHWRIVCESCVKNGVKYVMYISKVTGHNREKRERFFATVRQIFEYRNSTPQWNGARARELMTFPMSIPEDCTCRCCRLARENQLGRR